jgi:RHS repeat-associated protein
MSYVCKVAVCLFISILSVSAPSLSAATITELLPASAPHGARAIVVGSALDAGSIAVTFAAAGGGTATAAIISRSPSAIEVVVPANAVSGDVRVSDVGTLPFTLLSEAPFANVTTLAASDQGHDLFKNPSGVAVIPSTGAVVIADRSHHQVSLVAPNGQITVLAGGGKPGLVDGTGVQAKFKEPSGIAVDDTQKLIYVADSGNNVIRRVTYDGIVTTLAGSGRDDDFKQPAGLAIDSAGNVYVADTGNSRIRLISPQGAVMTLAGGGHEGFADGAAAQALFKQPGGIAVDASGVIFVADTKNNVIRKIENGLVSTIAGTGHGGYADGNGTLAEFKEPSGISVDDAGTLYVADTKNNLIRRIVLTGVVSTLAGIGKSGWVDGDPVVAQFNQPGGIAFASAIYIADTGNDALRIIVPALHVAAVYPHAGPIAGGNQVRILGTGFLPGVTQVSFGLTPATAVTSITPTELLVTVPSGTAGVVELKVTTPSASDTLAASYIYLPPPTIASLTPRKGKTTGGELTTLLGTNFVGGDTSVSFAGTAAPSVLVLTPSTATATTPAGSSGPADVTLSTPGGTATLPLGFTFFAPPTIVSFSPISGRVGTSVTLAGTNFDPEASGNRVTFAGTLATVGSATSTSIAVTVPNGALSGPLSLTTAGGTATTANAFTVVTYASIAITPAQIQLNTTQSKQLTLTGIVPGGTSVDVTSQAVWTSLNPAIATVDANGLVQAIGAGATTIRAVLAGLIATAPVTVAAVDAPPPDPSTVATAVDSTVITSFADATAFLYSGPNAIQRNVTPGAIASQRVAVIRGKVVDKEGSGIVGVRVAVVGQPSLGYAVTRQDGSYDLAVNGGATWTLLMSREGFLPVRRQVVVPWQDYVAAPTIALLPFDAHVTTIDLSQATAQTARGSAMTDADGTRQATLVFAPSTTATMVLPDGTTRPLTTLSVRATEYTVGAAGAMAMPADLPPQSGYTYCVELSVDEALAAGATTVQFSKPVAFYLENFLGFAVGSPVPTGYYDTVAGQWRAVANGRVVKIVGITNGLADIDVNGDGTADTPLALATLGMTDAERAQLAASYSAGVSLWRVALDHFTTWDCNWPVGPPEDASNPNQPFPGIDSTDENSCTAAGSIIQCQNRTLGEEVPVAGTPFTLHYSSDRVLGRTAARTLNISVSGITVPSSLRRIDVLISIAGQLTELHFPPLPNQSYKFVWDGKDSYGRVLQGRQPFSLSIGYVYPLVYGGPQETQFGFARYGNALTNIPARREAILWQQQSGFLGAYDAAGLGGWTIDVAHTFDRRTGVFYYGDGTTHSAQTAGLTVKTIVTGLFTAQSYLMQPAIAPDGSLYYTDFITRRVLKRTLSGALSVVAGGGSQPASVDGIPATSASISSGATITVAPDGTLYIADFGNNRVRKVDANGLIRTVAGNGSFGFLNDVPALQAKVDRPTSVAVSKDGTLYIADVSHIRMVGADGYIHTFAGTGNQFDQQIDGDGMLATELNLSSPQVAAGPDGTVYIVNDPWILSVGADGRTHRVAGGVNPFVSGPQGGDSGDGGPARDAFISGPFSLQVAKDGTLFFIANGRIRRITPDGVIASIAGVPREPNGQVSPKWLKTDGNPATATNLDLGGFGIALSPTGDLYVADRGFYTGQSTTTGMIRTLQLPFGGLSNFTSTYPSSDGVEVYDFDAAGRHTRTRDAITNATLYTFTYDASGQLASVKDRDDLVTTIERDGVGNASAIVAPGGQRTNLSIGPDGYLRAITDPAGSTDAYTYYPGGLLSTYTDPRSSITHFTFDTGGLLIKDTGPDGASTTLTSGPTPGDVSMVSTMGRTASFHLGRSADGSDDHATIDAAGLATSVSRGIDGTTTTATPDGVVETDSSGGDVRFGLAAPVEKTVTVTMPSGLSITASRALSVSPAGATDPSMISALTHTSSTNGKVWTDAFTTATRTWLSTSPAGRTRTTTLDAHNRIVAVTQPGLASLAMTYDPTGQLTLVQSGERAMSMTYDEHRRLASVTDALHNTTRFEYDLADELISKTMPDGRVIHFSYDGNGNVTSITPPMRPTHFFSFTSGNIADAYTPPISEATRYGYNADRQITLITRPDHTTLGFAYDTAGRLQNINTTAGAYTYSYDNGTGQIARIGGPNGNTLMYTFDGPLLTSETWTGAVQGSINRSYDSDLRVASENGTLFTYDADGLVTAAGALTLQRDAQSGRIASSTIGNLLDSWGYNLFGEPITFTATYNDPSAGPATFLSNAYTRDAAGRITQNAETYFGTTSTLGYTYGDDKRLSTVTKEGAVIASYHYDANGNRRSKTAAGTTIAATYDDEDHLLTYGGTSYSYSPNGALAQKTDATGTTTYTYDPFGNLQRVALPGGRIIDYIIDAAGRRVGKAVNGVVVTRWLYLDQWRIGTELDGTGVVTARFVWATRTNVPDYVMKAGSLYAVVSDHVGSPRAVVDTATGLVVWNNAYDEFGKPAIADAGVIPFGFAGGLYDADTKLVHFGAREYDPETGRWTSKDPIGFGGGSANVYGYASGDPVNFIDPSGLKLCWLWLPGAGWTLLDERFAPVVEDFFETANELGVQDLARTPGRTGFRSTKQQQDLRRNRKATGATTPAEVSLHEAGFAIDVNYRNRSAAEQKAIRDAAAAAGLGWGGNFPRKDDVHFFMDPWKGNKKKRKKAVDAAQRDYQSGLTCDKCN